MLQCNTERLRTNPVNVTTVLTPWLKAKRPHFDMFRQQSCVYYFSPQRLGVLLTSLPFPSQRKRGAFIELGMTFLPVLDRNKPVDDCVVGLYAFLRPIRASCKAFSRRRRAFSLAILRPSQMWGATRPKAQAGQEVCPSDKSTVHQVVITCKSHDRDHQPLVP